MNQQLIQNQRKVERNISEHLTIGQVTNLIAVTKSVDTTMMRSIYENGLRHFGENRTNVLIEKQQELSDLTSIVWHFIGNLQTRQVKDIINQVDYIHSLDRLSLAKEIDKRAETKINCFVQVNVSGEASKSGIEPDEVLEFVASLELFSNIRVVGLMTMAPFNATDEALHHYFKTLKSLQTFVAEQEWLHAPCTELSMGMSQDYSIAVEEGATFVRVGTALFEGVNHE